MKQSLYIMDMALAALTLMGVGVGLASRNWSYALAEIVCLFLICRLLFLRPPGQNT